MTKRQRDWYEEPFLKFKRLDYTPTFNDIDIIIHSKNSAQPPIDEFNLKMRSILRVKVSDGTEIQYKILPKYLKTFEKIPPYQNYYICGGSVVNALRNDHYRFFIRGDIDIFLCGGEDANIELGNALDRLGNTIFTQYNLTNAELRGGTVNFKYERKYEHEFHMEEPPKNIQFITDLYKKTVYQVIGGFDLENCMVAYNNGVLYADKRFVEYMKTGIINIIGRPNVKTRLYGRIAKYENSYNIFSYGNVKPDGPELKKMTYDFYDGFSFGLNFLWNKKRIAIGYEHGRRADASYKAYTNIVKDLLQENMLKQ
jgi:hypothetical protein